MRQSEQWRAKQSSTFKDSDFFQNRQYRQNWEDDKFKEEQRKYEENFYNKDPWGKW